MADKPVINAPVGWQDYAAGEHYDASASPAATAGEQDFLSFLKQLDLGVMEPVVTPSSQPDEPFSWQLAESADLIRPDPSDRQAMSRLEALESVARKIFEIDVATLSDWADRVAAGRLCLHLAQALQRGQQPNAARRIEHLLSRADAAFTGLEGEDFFLAQAHVVRGRVRAWKNDIIGATASHSFALSTFRKYKNLSREADAAYELAIANLDANLPDPALPLFDLAIEAHRALNRDGDALARSLQSKARALLVKARQAEAEQAMAYIEAAEAHALEAFRLSAPDHDPENLRPLVDGSVSDAPSPLAVPSPFRAAMAARDLGEACIQRVQSGSSSASTGQETARQWLQIAAEKLDLGEIFAEAGRQSMRQVISGADAVRFDVLRIAQLEFEILALSAPDKAASLLIETGKRFENKTYTIECFEAAARCFDAETDRTGDAGLGQEATYWRARAGRLALSIGYRSGGRAAVPDSVSEPLRQAFEEIRSRQAFNLLQVETATDDLLRAEIILSGRQSVSRLIILSPKPAGQIDLPRLAAISERGDIPQILDHGRTEAGSLYVIEEIALGRRLSDMLHSGLPPASRIRLAARLCRTVAALIRAHDGAGGKGRPLLLTLDDIMIEPGHRAVVTNFGPLADKQAPSIGWSFLYPGEAAKSATLSDGLDARAVARMLIILFGIEAIEPGNLWRGSYLRRALPLKRKPLDQLSLKAVGALSKLAEGKLTVERSFETSLSKEKDQGSRGLKGVSELLYLASLLDSSANA